MNLANLRKEVGQLAGRVDPDWSGRIRRFLNEAQTEWATAVPWPTLVRNEDLTANGNQNMVLPQRVLFVRSVADKTNKRPVTYQQHWDREFPTAYFGETTGAAMLTRERGLVPITSQPSTPMTYSVQAQASDVCTVYIGGLVQDTTASGTPDFQYFDQESIAISNDSVVAGTKSFVRVEVLGKNDFSAADIVVRDSSSNVVSRIPALDYSAEYRQLQFLHIPPAGTVFDMEYIQKPAPLVNDYQVPHPSIKANFLVWYAAGMVHEAQGQLDQARVKMARAQTMLDKEIYRERGHGDRDWRAVPEFNYWNDEDQYEV